MPNNDLSSVVNNTLIQLNTQLAALRLRYPANSLLSDADAKTVYTKIHRIIEQHIERAFQLVNISDIPKLKRRLSLAMHPDKIRGTQLASHLQPILTQSNTPLECTLIPQQILNDINAHNPLGFFRASQPQSNQQGAHSTHTLEKDDLFAWLEGLGHRSSQHMRYPEPLRSFIIQLHKLIDGFCAIVLTATMLFFYFEPSGAISYIFISILLTAGLELLILENCFDITSEEKEQLKMHDGFNFNYITFFQLFSQVFTRKFRDEQSSQQGLSGVFTIMGHILASILYLLLFAYVELMRISVLFVCIAPAVALKLTGVHLLNLPLYVYDGFQACKQAFGFEASPPEDEYTLSVGIP